MTTTPRGADETPAAEHLPAGAPLPTGPGSPEPVESSQRRPRRRSSLGRQGVEMFLENRLAVLGLVLIVGLVLFSFVGPLLHRTDQVHTDLANA